MYGIKKSIPFIQGKCKSALLESTANQMKNALKSIEYTEFVVGPNKVSELFDNNSDKTSKYPHTIFDNFINDKIRLDYNIIKDGLELLSFYKTHNKYLKEFDTNIEELYKLLEITNKSKYLADDIQINIGSSTPDKFKLNKLKKVWIVTCNKLGSNKSETFVSNSLTFSDAMLLATDKMTYGEYNEIRVTFKS